MIDTFRMHPMTIITSIINTFKDTFIIILLLFVFNFRDVSLSIIIGRLLFLLFLFLRFIYIIIDWWKTTYEIKDGMIQKNRGVFQKKQNSIPLQEIQNITWQTPFYYRWFHITSLHLETSSANEGASVQLDAIKDTLAHEIEGLATTYQRKSIQDDITVETNETPISEKQPQAEGKDESKRTIHFTPTKRQVIKASFLSFSFLGLIPLIAIALREIDKIVNIDQQVEGAFNYLTSSWLLIAGAILLFLLLAVGFGVIKTFLQYGKYEIASDKERIFIHSGILNEKAFSIQKANVQAIRLNQSFLKKWLHFTEVELISAGSDDEEGENISTLYPFLPSNQARGLLKEILPQFPLITAKNKLPRQALYMRLLRIPWFWLIATALLLWLKIEWWYISPVLFVTTYLSRYFTYRNTRFSWNEQAIQFKTGGLSTDIFITNRKKVIEAKVTQSIIQKKLGLATIETVNRVKPVHHETLLDVPIQDSTDFVRWYQQRINEIKVE